MTQLREDIIENYQLLETDTTKLPDGVLCRVQYPICNIGILNRNNRVYEKELWDGVLANKEVAQKLEKRSLYGQAEHPKETQSNLEKTSHVIHSMNVNEDGSKISQTMDVLDTPYGRIIDTLLRAGCGVGVSTRAEGELEECTDESNGSKYFRVKPESYDYVTTDFTADPSTIDPYPESVQRDVVREIAKDLHDNSIDRAFAMPLLESMQVDEAKELLKENKEKPLFEDFDSAFDWFKDYFNTMEEGKDKDKIREIITESNFDPNEIIPAQASTSIEDTEKEIEEVEDEVEKDIKDGETQKDTTEETVDDAEESINPLLAVKDALIKEASTRAELEKAIEIIEEHQCDENNVAIAVCKIKNLQQKLKEHSKSYDARTKALQTALTCNDKKTVKKVNALKISLKEYFNKYKTLDEVTKKKLDKLEQCNKKIVTEHKDRVIMIQEECDKKIVSSYITMKLEQSGLKLADKSRALLEDCKTVGEAETMLSDLRYTMRENALHHHSGVSEEAIIIESTTSKLEDEIVKNVRSSLAGMS